MPQARVIDQALDAYGPPSSASSLGHSDALARFSDVLLCLSQRYVASLCRTAPEPLNGATQGRTTSFD